MKRVLVVYYSQTGQLRRVAESLCAPLTAAGIEVDWCALQPQQAYPFPWPFFRFFDQFPETVHLDPPALQALSIDPARHYDLVVLAYTVWFLSPAPPVTAFLKSADARQLLANRPVVTLIACRNMWLLAQEIVKDLLAKAGARLCDNIVLTDRGSALTTFVTTPRWMLTGRQEAFWRVFPRAGLDEQQIAASARFGTAIARRVQAGSCGSGQPMLRGLGAASADMRLLPSERIGRRSFLIWGRLIRALGPQGAALRKPALALYALFLAAMIVSIVPVTMLLRMLLRPFAASRMRVQKQYFEQPSGSGTDAMHGSLSS